MFRAHTTEDGITSDHCTRAQAKAACAERVGPGNWMLQSLPYGDVDTMGEDRGLYAVVYPACIQAAVVDDFGLYVD